MKYGEVKKFEAKVKFKIEIMVTGSISIRWLFQHLADVTWSKLTLIYRNSNTKAKNNPRFFIIFPSFFAYPPAFSCSIWVYSVFCVNRMKATAARIKKKYEKKTEKIPKSHLVDVVIIHKHQKTHTSPDLHTHSPENLPFKCIRNAIFAHHFVSLSFFSFLFFLFWIVS